MVVEVTSNIMVPMVTETQGLRIYKLCNYLVEGWTRHKIVKSILGKMFSMVYSRDIYRVK